MSALIESVRGCLPPEPVPGPTPTLRVRVRRDTRLLGPGRRVFVGGWERGTFETHHAEQLTFPWLARFVSESVEVAVIDLRDSLDIEAGRDHWRLELASEQHLWTTHRDWTHDPVPTEIAYYNPCDDEQVQSAQPYAIDGCAIDGYA